MPSSNRRRTYEVEDEVRPPKKRPKTGRRRKRKRKLLKKVRKQQQPLSDAEVSEVLEMTGQDHWDNPKETNNPLLAMARRWNTDFKAEDLKGVDTSKLTAKEIFMLVTRKNMLHDDPGVANSACRNFVAAEAQNQKDDHESNKPDAQPQQHLHLHAGGDNPFANCSTETLLKLQSAFEEAEEESRQGQDKPPMFADS